MLTWILFALIAAAAALVLVAPLLRRSQHPANGPGDAHVGVYADQLAEIERDTASGLISPTEAAAARAEIGRRLLRAARENGAAAHESRFRVIAIAVVAVLLPLSALAIYAQLGRPDYADQPLVARAAPAGGAGDLPRLLARAEERLRAEPDDGAGWAVVAPIYLRTQRFAEAVEAFRNANLLLGEDAQRLTGLGEALTLRDGRVVGEEARAAFEKALVLAPDAVPPQIYLAIAARQAGRTGEARMAWNALIEKARGDEPWLALASHELALLDGGGAAAAADSRAGAGAGAEAGAGEGEDEDRSPTSATGTGDPPALARGAPTAAADAPSAAAGAAPAEQRQAMIEGMVSRLAMRLDAEGGSAEEYIRLVRSYVVLGRRDDAVRAMESGLAALAAEPEAQASLREAAGELGLTIK